jgi:hypothetical protein
LSRTEAIEAPVSQRSPVDEAQVVRTARVGPSTLLVWARTVATTLRPEVPPTFSRYTSSAPAVAPHDAVIAAWPAAVLDDAKYRLGSVASGISVTGLAQFPPAPEQRLFMQAVPVPQAVVPQSATRGSWVQLSVPLTVPHSSPVAARRAQNCVSFSDEHDWHAFVAKLQVPLPPSVVQREVPQSSCR